MTFSTFLLVLFPRADESISISDIEAYQRSLRRSGSPVVSLDDLPYLEELLFKSADDPSVDVELSAQLDTFLDDTTQSDSKSFSASEEDEFDSSDTEFLRLKLGKYDSSRDSAWCDIIAFINEDTGLPAINQLQTHVPTKTAWGIKVQLNLTDKHVSHKQFQSRPQLLKPIPQRHPHQSSRYLADVFSHDMNAEYKKRILKALENIPLLSSSLRGTVTFRQQCFSIDSTFPIFNCDLSVSTEKSTSLTIYSIHTDESVLQYFVEGEDFNRLFYKDVLDCHDIIKRCPDAVKHSRLMVVRRDGRKVLYYSFELVNCLLDRRHVKVQTSEQWRNALRLALCPIQRFETYGSFDDVNSRFAYHQLWSDRSRRDLIIASVREQLRCAIAFCVQGRAVSSDSMLSRLLTIFVNRNTDLLEEQVKQELAHLLLKQMKQQLGNNTHTT